METKKTTQAQFFTRQRAGEGARLELLTPEGERTPFWLLVRGRDSDHFKAADALAKRKMVEYQQANGKQTAQEIIAYVEQAQLELVAELVMGWNFEEPFTRENLLAFLKEAPQIANEVNAFCGDRERFFKKSSQSSGLTSGVSASSSNLPLQAQPSP